MSVKQLRCPGCGQTVNVAAAMTNVRCPSCGTVWNVANPGAAQVPASVTKARAEESKGSDAKKSLPMAAIMAGVLSAFVGLACLFALVAMLVTRDSDEAVEVAVDEPTIKPRVPEPYRIVRLPEDTRKRIYNDYRKVARTTVETPLPAKQGSVLRNSLESTLGKTFDRELMRFAALHDVTVDDIKEIIKEGDAKVWDSSPRSNAKRDGIRVYPKEMSEGLKQ